MPGRVGTGRDGPRVLGRVLGGGWPGLGSGWEARPLALVGEDHDDGEGPEDEPITERP